MEDGDLMPIYEYDCKSCGQRFEKIQPVSAEPLTQCLNCGAGPIQRVYHPVGVIFKGSGWYINDSRKSNKPEKATSDTSKESSGDSGGGETSGKGEGESTPSATASASTDE